MARTLGRRPRRECFVLVLGVGGVAFTFQLSLFFAHLLKTLPISHHPSLTKFATAGSFINFAPCVLSESATGADISAVGLNIIPRLVSIRTAIAEVGGTFLNLQPQLIFINNVGLSVSPQGLSVQPGLIYVGAIGANVQPQGANIQPQAITIAPIGSNVQPQGAVVAPVRKLIAPTHISYTPKKESIGDVGIDLTDPKVLASFPAGGKVKRHAGH